MKTGRVAVERVEGDARASIRRALDRVGVLERVTAGTRVAIKPNLTYPFHRAGITTSPPILRALVSILREHTSHVAIVESDGGYGIWTAPQAFAGHGVGELVREFEVEAVNLCDEAREWICFESRGQKQSLPLPVRLLHDTDVFITVPVPKIHAMTGLTLSYKNQWGCIPDAMRLRRHYVFDDAIVAIDRALRPAVLCDGTTFLDDNGPMEGTPVPMNLVIAADRAGSFDRYVAELMGFPWHHVTHLRNAARLGDLPESLDAIESEFPPEHFRTRRFKLRRSLRNWIALSGFKSRFLTWFGYESWFGRVVLHGILYAIAGRPEPPSSAPPA